MRGRPRKFDRDVALAQAMDVFWSKGYEATQVADLNRAMGINSPSFYATFEGKEQLFLEALERYRVEVGELTMLALEDEANAVRAVRVMLSRTVDVVLTGEKRRGCMIMVGVAGGDPAVYHLHDLLRGLREQTVERIRGRLLKGIEDEQLLASTDVDAMATYYGMILQGLSLQARDGTPREALERIVDLSMAALEACAQSGLADRRIHQPAD